MGGVPEMSGLLDTAGAAPEARRGMRGIVALLSSLGVVLLLVAGTAFAADGDKLRNVVAGLPWAGLGLLALTTSVSIRARARSGEVLGWMVAALGSLVAVAAIVSEAGYLDGGGLGAAFAPGIMVAAGLVLLFFVSLMVGLWRSRATFATKWRRSDALAFAVALLAVGALVAPLLVQPPPLDEPGVVIP
jgi:hypothetical protein